MPGHWKRSAEGAVASSWDLAVLAHVGLFAVICGLLPRARPWALRAWHVPAVGLALALATEGLQFFAVDRHPSAAGLAQDMLGTCIGWAVGQRWLAALPAPLRG
jgi:VanZ family protein